MKPACPKCTSGSTRRNRRSPSLKHKLMYLLGRFPWECLTCQNRFFHKMRYAKSARSPQGEVYCRAANSTRVSAREQFPVAGRVSSAAQLQTQAGFKFDNLDHPGPSRRQG